MSQKNIIQVAALNNYGSIVGIYAVDELNPQLPGIEYNRIIKIPDQPQASGKILRVPLDIENPDGPYSEVMIFEWPTLGWSYLDETGWIPPQ